MNYQKQERDEFSKLVDRTYQYLGIQDASFPVKTEPDRGNLLQEDFAVYSSERAEGYSLQRIMEKMQ